MNVAILLDTTQDLEKRFLIEWDHGSDSMWFGILACSRPRHALARLGYPFVRRMQKKFERDSAAAMQQAVDFSSIGV